MSYCRWSSDGWTSDVYCYADVAGDWVIHVAHKRYMHPMNEPCPRFDMIAVSPEYIQSFIMDEERWMSEAQLVPIGLPGAGDTFRLDSAAECADKLDELRATGFHVPLYATDALREEAEEEGE